MNRRLVLMLQFWQGDKEAAMRNARRIADNEPTFREDVEFFFTTRFGTEHDAETMEYVSKKFKVTSYTSNRRDSGWPNGPNALWCDSMMECHRRVKSGDWAWVKAVFTFEADCIPVHREWVNRLHKEWDETERIGKWLTGWLGPHADTGHINGNALFHPNIFHFIPQIAGAPANVAWDCAFARLLQPHWRAAAFLENLYNQRGNSEEQLQDIVNSGVVLIHGVKDLSVENFADKLLLK